MGYAVKQPKNDSPQNQDLTPPKSFFEGVQNPNFEYKKKIIIIIVIIIIVFPIISINYYQMLLL